MSIKIINKTTLGSLDHFVAAFETCVANAQSASTAQKTKWFGNGYNNTKVVKCLGDLSSWATNSSCSMYFKSTSENDIASAKIKTNEAKLLGGGLPFGKGITIGLGTNWNASGAVDGDRLLAIIHEVTHKVIHSLDIVDNSVIPNYSSTIRSQIPGNLLSSGREYYGFKRVLELRNMSTAAAILNADNWAYFIAEFRATNSCIRFLSKDNELTRGSNWGGYTPDTTTAINTGAFL